MADISQDYYLKLLRQIQTYSRHIQAVYNTAIIDISFYAASIKVKGEVISIDTLPALKKKMDEVIAELHEGIYTTMLNGINESWSLSNAKNNLISRRITGGKTLAKEIHDLVYNPNAEALKAFSNRKEKGMNLSKRVWNLVEPFRYELEAGVLDGISQGKAATSMAKDMQRYLNEPEKLFRRVRDSNGKLKLSKAAEAYHPGQGVYRSSYKNALRLTRTENNLSYRSADFERWKTMPFVKGLEVRTSAQHPVYDICDPLAGSYPKDFKFTGWHPQCLCHSVPVLATDDEYNKMEDYMLGITDQKPVLKGVSNVPGSFNDYLKKNKETINGWKNTPYWVKDNKKYTKALK